MSEQSRFTGKTGLAEDFFEPDKLVHYAVEAPIGQVSAGLAMTTSFFARGRGEELDLETGVFGKPCGDVPPLFTVFQIRGLSWTQIAADIRHVRGLPLARHLSEELQTRCLCLEVTDDMYQSHALFDRGVTEELYVLNMNVGMKRLLTSVGLEVPAEFAELDEEDLDVYDEVEYTYRREGDPAPDAEALVSRAGAYLHTPFSLEGVHGVGDLKAEDLVRMDVIRDNKCV